MAWIYTDTGSIFLDETTRTATVYDEHGEQVSTRPYTAEENAIADAADTAALEESNRASIEESLAAALADLQAVIDQSNADLRADPSQEIKTISRAMRRTIRLLIRRFDGTT